MHEIDGSGYSTNKIIPTESPIASVRHRVNSSTCPNPNRLSAFFAGELATVDHLHVFRHLLDCETCKKRSSELGMPVPARRTYPDPDEFSPTVSSNQQVQLAAVAVLERIGPYQVHKLIGRGGMGAVYEATHVRLGKAVAIKVLPRTAALDPEQMSRFEREVLAAGKLDHPNVVRATDAGEHEGIPYLVMELVDGVDLARVLRVLGPLPVLDACEVVRQAAVGLAHAHGRGIVHRDAKPSNLMITADGVVKVLDLGLAVFVSTVGRNDERITGMVVLGTFDYMAPEQWENASTVTDKADVYALGCLLFQSLIGRPPFSSPTQESPHAKRRSHQMAPLPSLETLFPEVPLELADLIRRMTSKRPEDRPSAAAVATALNRFIPNAPALGRLVARTRLAPAGEFTDGRPTTLAPIQPDPAVQQPTVFGSDETAHSKPSLIVKAAPRRSWKKTAVVILTLLGLIGVVALIRVFLS
jgi:eukaryotic-like serine/threonine-protein kinase